MPGVNDNFSKKKAAGSTYALSEDIATIPALYWSFAYFFITSPWHQPSGRGVGGGVSSPPAPVAR